jgi:nicotinamidase/pyrazinamidase
MKPVFFDIDTQIDFMYQAGALYVPGAERILPGVAGLNRFAAEHGFPLISTADAHAEDDPEFRLWPPHCVIETPGQRKPAATLLEDRIVVPNRACEFSVEGARQIVVEKQTLDVFDTRNIGRLLERLRAEMYVVYGVATEICVKRAALGLLKTGKPVTLITDAVKGIDPNDCARAVEEFQASGGILATIGEICGQLSVISGQRSA